MTCRDRTMLQEQTTMLQGEEVTMLLTSS